MGKWAERAAKLGEAETCANSADNAGSLPFGTNDTIGTASPARVLRHWHTKLAALDPAQAPDGFEAKEWWRLWDDACWLLSTHSKAAVLNGWDAQSLFGVWVGYPPAGGLAQQLRGSRTLLFEGPRAVYRLWGVSTKVNIGTARGLPAIWEIQ